MTQNVETPRHEMRGSAGYAQSGDFCRVFLGEMSSLYLLSLLLTGNREQAEQCFVRGVEDCAGENHVFKEWAHSWARRVVIQNAIRLTGPFHRSETYIAHEIRPATTDLHTLPANADLLAAVLRLDVRDRMVFVLSVLEEYSDHDCALFLGCIRREVVTRRTHALLRLTEANAVCLRSQEAVQVSTGYPY